MSCSVASLPATWPASLPSCTAGTRAVAVPGAPHTPRCAVMVEGGSDSGAGPNAAAALRASPAAPPRPVFSTASAGLRKEGGEEGVWPGRTALPGTPALPGATACAALSEAPCAPQAPILPMPTPRPVLHVALLPGARPPAAPAATPAVVPAHGSTAAAPTAGAAPRGCHRDASTLRTDACPPGTAPAAAPLISPAPGAAPAPCGRRAAGTALRAAAATAAAVPTVPVACGAADA